MADEPKRVLTPEAEAAMKDSPAPLDAKPPFEHKLPDEELQVIAACWSMLEKLNYDAQCRVISYLTDRLET